MPSDSGSRGRLALAALALPILLAGVWYVTLVGGLLLPLTPRVNFALSGAVASAAAIWAAFAITPPRLRTRAAIAMAVLAAVMQVWYLRNERGLSAALPFGCALAAVLIALLSSSPKKRTMTGVLAGATILLLGACYVDFPALSRPVNANDEPELRAHPVSAFHSYTLHDFFDSGYLWRIDAAPADLEAIAADFGMQKRAATPDVFWRMAPYYWPRHAPEGGQFYATEDFPQPSDRNGACMLIDAKRGRAYLWREQWFLH